MIGTHDSLTGEKSYGFLSKLVTIFAKTQCSNIVEQYVRGCRYFDLRVAYDKKRKIWVGAHGLWKTKHDINHFIDALNHCAKCDATNVYISITLEGCTNKNNNGVSWVLNNNDVDKFTKDFGEDFINRFKRNNKLILQSINIKSPWISLYNGRIKLPKLVHRFKTLDGRSWHTYIPIPWLWHKIYKFKNEDDKLNLVEFL